MKPLLLIVLAASAFAQTAPPAPPSFDVASVRPSKPGASQHSNVPLDAGNIYTPITADDDRTAAGGYLIATHQPLWRYITFAYKLSGTQELALRFSIFPGLPKSGAPTWVTGTVDAPGDFFDIEARASGNPSLDQMRLMMQALLADRFHLVLHHDTHDAPVFALVLVHPGVNGPNLQSHPASDACSPASSATDQPAAGQPAPPLAAASSTVGDLPPICGIVAHVPSATNPREHYGGRAIPLSLLATSMPTMTGLAALPRPVVDQTGLTGLYDFTLHFVWSPDPDTGDTASSFRESLKAQLGLELKSTRAPIDILVIDHIEHPSEN
jgi:uncharacterized protein (TIGR03435 family)